MRKINKYNINTKFLLDIFINISGTALPIIVLQLYILPSIAQIITDNMYGEIQSILSFIYIISGTIGNSLSSLRLIKHTDYKDNNIVADFRVISRNSTIWILVLMPIAISLYISEISFLDVVLTTIVAALNYLNLYGQVGFRLKLNFKELFINKLLGVVGYFLGYLLFLKYKLWQLIFIMSFLVQFIHCYCYTEIYKEMIVRSSNFYNLLKSFFELSISTLFKKSFMYFDKIILLPLLGGKYVSIYFVANIFGKFMLQALEPITNVILSYLAQEKRVSKIIWKKSCYFGIIFCLIIYILTIFFSKPILMLFYPQWTEEALVIIPITTLGLCFSTMVGVLEPLALKAIEMKKQVYINASVLVIYIICCLILYKIYGLLGCCWALCISNIIKLSFIYIFGYRNGE